MAGRLSDDAEIDRIHNLVGKLSDAFWDRISQPDVSALDELIKAEQLGHDPQSDRDINVWRELTSPWNFSALRKYIRFCNDQPSGINDYAAKLHEHLLQDAERRLNASGGGLGRIFGCSNLVPSVCVATAGPTRCAHFL